jgi:hypothetical protein
MNMMRVGRMSRQRYKRRANALSALGDTIAAVQTIFGPVLPHQAIAALVKVAPHLSKYGITVIANGPAWHLHEDWPGMDRRKVSGSIWDGRQPMSNAPWAGRVRCAHRSWQDAAQQLAAFRGMHLFRHGGMGAAWLDAGPAGDALRLMRAAALDRGAPVPLCAQQERLTRRSSQNRSFLVERGVAYPGAAIGCGGATSGDKQSATKAIGSFNAETCRQRDLDQRLGDWCERQERCLPRETAWEIVIRNIVAPIDSVAVAEPFVPVRGVRHMVEQVEACLRILGIHDVRPVVPPPLVRCRQCRRIFRAAARKWDAVPAASGYRGFRQRTLAEPLRLSREGRALERELRKDGRSNPRIIDVKDASAPLKPLEVPDLVDLVALASQKVRDADNRRLGPRVRIATIDRAGPLFGMRKADMAAAARIIGAAARPDLYWPPPRSIPMASPRDEIFVMKLAKSVKEYAKAA